MSSDAASIGHVGDRLRPAASAAGRELRFRLRLRFRRRELDASNSPFEILETA